MKNPALLKRRWTAGIPHPPVRSADYTSRRNAGQSPRNAYLRAVMDAMTRRALNTED